jgi:hypothetical protein
MEQLTLWHEAAPAPPPGRFPPPEAAILASSFPGAAPSEALVGWLSRALGKPVELTWTENRSTMLSFRHRGEVLALRLHRMFGQAGKAEMLAVVRYLGGGNRRASRIIDDFIAAQARLDALRKVVEVQPVGGVHHLGDIFDELNAAYFHRGCTARITWGKAGAPARRSRSSIQLGCYVHDQNLIRMHPCLDQSFVPRFYVAGVVFHEMLHEVFGIARHNGRRVVHPPEFFAVEESHPDHSRCKAWEAENLARLLRFRPDA